MVVLNICTPIMIEAKGRITKNDVAKINAGIDYCKQRNAQYIVVRDHTTIESINGVKL